MRTDRRSFLGLVAGAFGALVVPARAPRADAGPALEIHRLTRNTRLGALGGRLGRWGGASSPALAPAGAPRVGLPEVAAAPSRSLAETVRDFEPAAGFRASELPLAMLARLLHLTNGVTGELEGGGVALRAAPSAGALYAGEVYVAAERIAGLAPGLYHFAVPERVLVRLREGGPLAEIAGALEEPDRIRGAAFAVLLSNVFGRYRARYANRGYRYALIDTGHIVENLRLASAAHGLGEAGFARFHDEQLNALLGSAGRGLGVCFVSAVGAPSPAGAAPPPAPRAPRRLTERDPRAALSPGRSIERYHAASELTGAPGGAEPGRVSADAEPAEATWGSPLPPRPDPALSVEAAIRARRSPLRFLPEPIEAADLGFVLAMARAHPALARAPGVELYAIAHRVRGLAPGLHATDGSRVALRRAGDLREPLVAACLGQELAGQASAALLMVARPAAAAARDGPRSYRDLLVESGAIAQRIYLAAESLHLSARNLAAFVDDDLADLLGFGPDGRAVLHLTLLGRKG